MKQKEDNNCLNKIEVYFKRWKDPTIYLEKLPNNLVHPTIYSITKNQDFLHTKNGV